MKVTGEIHSYLLKILIFLTIGLTFEKSLENNYKNEDNIRNLSESEQINRVISLATIFAILIIGFYIFLLLMFLKSI